MAATGYYATDTSIEAITGVENLTIYSDLDGAGVRNDDRIAYALAVADIEIDNMLAYNGMSRIPTTHARFSVLTVAAANFAAANLYGARGMRDSEQHASDRADGWRAEFKRLMQTILIPGRLDDGITTQISAPEPVKL